MRATLATTALAAAVILLVTMVVPQTPVTNVNPSAQAQFQRDAADPAEPGSAAPAAAADPADPAVISGFPLAQQDEANAAAAEKLSQRIVANFDTNELANVLDYIRNTTDVDMVVQWGMLAGVEIKADTPITLNLRSVRADVLIDLVLEQAIDQVAPGREHPGFTLRDGIVFISPTEALSRNTEIRIYNVRDLLGPGEAAMSGMMNRGGIVGPMLGGAAGGFGYVDPQEDYNPAGGSSFDGDAHGGPAGAPGMYDPAAHRASQLVGLIETMVDSQGWASVGGDGQIALYNGLLVVRHTADVHEQVRRLIQMLREATAPSNAPADAAADPFGAGAPAARTPGRGSPSTGGSRRSLPNN